MIHTRDLSGILTDSSLFANLPPEILTTVAGCARNINIANGEMLGREGEPQNVFYLVRKGKIAVQSVIPGRGVVTLQTLTSGDVLGWSWIFPPYLWQFDARALEDTLAIVIDGACLRDKCNTDHSLGYELMKRMAAVMTSRLRATRLQLMDLYAPPGGSPMAGGAK